MHMLSAIVLALAATANTVVKAQYAIPPVGYPGLQSGPAGAYPLGTGLGIYPGATGIGPANLGGFQGMQMTGENVANSDFRHKSQSCIQSVR